MEAVCCMCGDVGFSDKLFRCSKCRHRSQHLYCSSYYGELSESIQVCDFCQSEERNSKHAAGSSSRKSMQVNNDQSRTKTTYSTNKIKIKQHDLEEGSEKAGKTPRGPPSPRPTTRRYKLLKDVMC